MQIVSSSGTPVRTMEEWFKYAGPKGKLKHWVDGRSAKECARAWCNDGTPAPPSEIVALLESHADTRDARFISGTPELKIRFDTIRGEPRNADFVALAEQRDGKLAINVEAKVDESFDRLVGEMLAEVADRVAHGERTRLDQRIRQLAAALLPPPANDLPRLGELHYQLLTATAGTLANAAAMECRRVVLVIHEFRTSSWDAQLSEANGVALDRFVHRLTGGQTTRVPEAKLIGPIRVPGAPLFPEPPALYIGKAVRQHQAQG